MTKFLFQRLLAVGLFALVIASVAAVRLGQAPAGLPSFTGVPTFSAAQATQESTPESAIQQVISRANAEQVQAIAQGDPSVMADTSTTDYYQQMVQTNQSLLDHGITSIQLAKLEWGPIDVQGNTATATTYETWRTTLSDGPVEVSRDRNVYQLVQDDSGTWKIAADDHPDSGAQGSAPTLPDSPVPPRGSFPQTAETSRNWAGYAAAGTFTSVTGTWTVPDLPLDGSNGASATWVGIGGLRSRDLIQAGTQESSSGSGRVEYEAWIEMLPDVARPVPLVVQPGDSITITITQQEPGTWLLSFKNNTTGQTYERTAQYNSTLSSAEWIEEAPSVGRRGVLPIDQFGSITFSSASAVDNGQSVSVRDAGARPITLIDNQRRPLAVPSELSDDGSSFTVTRTPGN
jgi:ketosteroid isomerase-like protein